MGDSFIILSFEEQKRLYCKVTDLRHEIRSFESMGDDSEMAIRIANNVQAAKKEINDAENLLSRSVHYTEVNAALGVNII
jgi:hypothetical protein